MTPFIGNGNAGANSNAGGNGNGNEKGHGSSNGAAPIKTKQEETRFLYDGMSVLKEYTGEGDPLREYHYAGEQVIGEKMFGFHDRKDEGREGNLRTRGGFLYYHGDAQGNVTDVTDHLGEEVTKYRYDTFGNLFTGIQAPYNTVGYTGKSYDPTSSLMDYAARWYSPKIGRFTSPDTFGGSLGQPLSMNLYSYVMNNPVNFIDPTGHSAMDAGLGGGSDDGSGSSSSGGYTDGGASNGGGYTPPPVEPTPPPVEPTPPPSPPDDTPPPDPSDYQDPTTNDGTGSTGDGTNGSSGNTGGSTNSGTGGSGGGGGTINDPPHHEPTLLDRILAKDQLMTDRGQTALDPMQYPSYSALKQQDEENVQHVNVLSYATAKKLDDLTVTYTSLQPEVAPQLENDYRYVYYAPTLGEVDADTLISDIEYINDINAQRDLIQRDGIDAHIELAGVLIGFTLYKPLSSPDKGGVGVGNTKIRNNVTQETEGIKSEESTSKSKNKPKENGTPNSTEIVRDENGNITKYTTYGPDGKIVKEVRISGKDHGDIPRPNVKEPIYNTNPKTGQQFQNGYDVRPAMPDEIPQSIP